MIPSRRLIVLSALFFGVIAPCGPRGARADELSSKLEKMLLKTLKPIFDQQRESSVAVGDVTAAPSLAASGGPAISNAMIEAFETIGIRTSRKARLMIEGRYRLAKLPSSALSSLRIDLTLSDQTDMKPITEVSIHVVDAATIMKLAGGTGDLTGDRASQSAKVEKALNDPTTEIGDDPASRTSGTRISASPGSPFAIELLVKSGPGDYRPRAAILRDGQAFVPLKKGEVYGLRLINDSDRAAGIEVAIDGLEMFAFSDAEADRKSRLIVGPKGSGRVIGWYRRNGPDGSNEFLVGSAAEAAAAKKLPPSSARLGMITATFAAAWPQGDAPPPGESLDDRRAEGLGTTLGAPTGQTFRPVAFEIGKPRAAITVRYDKPVVPADLPGN